jgi:hypothetical protein
MASTPTRTLFRRPALAGVGDRLREMFDAMTAGPMPAHLVDLVDQLEAQADDKTAEARCLNPA